MVGLIIAFPSNDFLDRRAIKGSTTAQPRLDVQVLRQQEPGLLPEHGGALRLNTTWAKSMLRRLGIRSRAGQPTRA